MKVHQNLKNVRHMLVNSSTMWAQQGKVLALWGQGCDILVIWDDSVDMDSLTGHLLESPIKKLIIVAETVVLNKSKYTFSILDDQVRFMQLDRVSQEQLLSVTVQFQGYDVPLGKVIGDEQNLQDMLHGDAIVQLKDKMKLGNSLMGETDYYEPLSFQCADYIWKTILPWTATVVPVTAPPEQTAENMEMLQQNSDDKVYVFENGDSVIKSPILLSANIIRTWNSPP
jgi:hypothetical protein